MKSKSTHLNFEEIHKSLQDHFYVNVPFLLERSYIEEAVEAFFEFLKEPELIKSHINFSIAPLHRRGDVGFKRRNPQDHVYNDSKEFFHFHPAIFKECASFLEKNPVVYDFLSKAKPIWDHAYKTVEDILKTFEPAFPGVYNKIFNTKHVHILLRFLKYDWKSSGKYLAKPHFDAGAFTLAITESCPGLRIGSCPENLKLIQHKEGNAIFMLASNYQKAIQTSTLVPGWHDVIQVDETLIGKPFARWAVVAFIEAHSVEALSRIETHKWHTDNDTPLF